MYSYSISQEICTRFLLCCALLWLYTLTDFPISIRLTSLALWQSNDCPSASKATLMNMDKYFMWIHYERLYNHNKAKHNKIVCIFRGIYCRSSIHDHDTRYASQIDTISTRIVMASNRIRCRLPDVINSTTNRILNKIETHSLHGFSQFAKRFFIYQYPTHGFEINCYDCRN